MVDPASGLSRGRGPPAGCCGVWAHLAEQHRFVLSNVACACTLTSHVPVRPVSVRAVAPHRTTRTPRPGSSAGHTQHEDSSATSTVMTAPRPNDPPPLFPPLNKPHPPQHVITNSRQCLRARVASGPASLARSRPKTRAGASERRCGASRGPSQPVNSSRPSSPSRPGQCRRRSWWCSGASWP